MMMTMKKMPVAVGDDNDDADHDDLDVDAAGRA